MADEWDESLSDQFLTVPWYSLQSSSPVLIKILITKGNLISCLVTDLDKVYYESLSQRQLCRRFTDAYSEALDTKKKHEIFTGIGDEEQEKLKQAISLLIQAIQGPNTKAKFEHESFEHVLQITLSDYSFRFVCDELMAPKILSTQLVVPLMGLSSSLLSVLTTLSPVSEQIEEAIDLSAKAERVKEGRAFKSFFQVGTRALGRWSQLFGGARQDLLDVTLGDATPKTTQVEHRPSASPNKQDKPEREPVKNIDTSLVTENSVKTAKLSTPARPARVETEEVCKEVDIEPDTDEEAPPARQTVPEVAEKSEEEIESTRKRTARDSESPATVAETRHNSEEPQNTKEENTPLEKQEDKERERRMENLAKARAAQSNAKPKPKKKRL